MESIVPRTAENQFGNNLPPDRFLVSNQPHRRRSSDDRYDGSTQRYNDRSRSLATPKVACFACDEYEKRSHATSLRCRWHGGCSPSSSTSCLCERSDRWKVIGDRCKASKRYGRLSDPRHDYRTSYRLPIARLKSRTSSRLPVYRNAVHVDVNRSARALQSPGDRA